MQVSQQAYHVDFSQVAGLWVMLGIAAGCSLLLVALHLWRHKWWPALRARPAVRRWLLCGGGGADSGRGLPVRLPRLETLIARAGSALQSAAAPHPTSNLASRRELEKQLSSASKVSDDSTTHSIGGASTEPPRRLSTGVAPRLPSAARPPFTLSPAASGAAYDTVQIQLAALTTAVEQLAAQVESQQALLAQQAAQQSGPTGDTSGAGGRGTAPPAGEKPPGRLSSMQRLMLGRVMRRYKDHSSTAG